MTGALLVGMREAQMKTDRTRKLEATARRWTALGTLPVVNGVLVGLNALYITLVVIGNISDFNVNQNFVHHVLAMDTTNFGQPQGEGLDPHVMWRALTAIPLQTTVYVGIIVWELTAAVVLISAEVLWILDRRANKPTACRISTIGLLMVVLLFFGGFIDIGGEWFQMWRSAANNGLDPAFRNVVLALVTLVLIHAPSHRSAGP
jgi:predicted small integral membrane protein